ncbi:MAG: hypothetical protein ACQZ3N_10035 [cyanobacterium endosymbiont of Rhopalodia yunnanensis]
MKFSISLNLALILSSSLLVSCEEKNKRRINSSVSNGLKLGVALPVTINLSLIVQNMPKAFILAIDKIKACDGVNDKPVTLITEDIQT